jgi:hypothetical protein
MFKTFVISIASVVFAGMLMSPASADTPTPYDSVAIEHRQVQITPSNNESPQVIGQSYPRRDFIAEEDAFGIQTSFLQSIGGFKDMGTDNCHTWNTQPCLKWGKSIGSTGLWGNIILPVCSTESSSACIEGLELSNSTSKGAATFSRYLNNQVSDDEVTRLNASYSGLKIHKSTWDASPRLGMPAASTPSLWSAPGFENLGGTNTYMVRVWMNVGVYESQRVPEIQLNKIQADIIPYSEVQDSSFEPPIWITYTDGPLKRSQLSLQNRPAPVDFTNFGNKYGQLCAWFEIDKCGVATRFSDGTTAQLKIRIPRDFGGWFIGRLENPELSINPVSKRTNLLTVSASPVEVPVTSAKWPLFDPDFKKYTDYMVKTKQICLECFDLWRKQGWGGDYNQWSPSMGVGIFKGLEGLMGDRSIGSKQIWSFSSLSLSSSDDSGAELSVGYDNPCFADKSRVQGILTTNSMVYQPGLPTFSKGQLSYQVAGLHYNHDGTEFTGEYTLQMRADDARCLYGYTEAPIQTKVSVTDSGGNQKIATTSVSERGGWLTIRARNFTFSSPKIVVSIKQGKKSKAASTSSVSVGKGKSLAAKTLMSKAKIKAKKGDKLDVSVVGEKTTGVTDSGKALKFKSKGTYNAKVTVVRKNGTSTSRVFKVVVK